MVGLATGYNLLYVGFQRPRFIVGKSPCVMDGALRPVGARRFIIHEQSQGTVPCLQRNLRHQCVQYAGQPTDVRLGGVSKLHYTGLNIKKKLHKPSRASYRNFY